MRVSFLLPSQLSPPRGFLFPCIGYVELDSFFSWRSRNTSKDMHGFLTRIRMVFLVFLESLFAGIVSSWRSLFWKWAPISRTNTRQIVNGNQWKLRKRRTDFLFKYEVECQNGDEIWRRTIKKRCLSEHQNMNIEDTKNLNEPKDAH
jgi:hypothetical protein